MKLEIKIEGVHVRAEGPAAVNALQAMFGWLRGSALAPAADPAPPAEEEEASDEGEEEEAEEPAIVARWPEANDEEEEPEEAEDDEGGPGGSNTESVFATLRSEARKAGADGWFQPPAVSGMAERIGLSVDQFRSAFAYLKKSGRIETHPTANTNPKPIRIPGIGGDAQ